MRRRRRGTKQVSRTTGRLSPGSKVQDRRRPKEQSARSRMRSGSPHGARSNGLILTGSVSVGAAFDAAPTGALFKLIQYVIISLYNLLWSWTNLASILPFRLFFYFLFSFFFYYFCFPPKPIKLTF